MNPSSLANDVDTAATPKSNKFQSSQRQVKASATANTPVVTPTSTLTNGRSENGYKRHGPNGEASLNGTPLQNGLGTNGYQNGARRDSTQAWTPLLASPNSTDSTALINGNGGAGGDSSLVGTETVIISEVDNVDAPEGNANPANDTTVLYATSTSNNNEWKDAEQSNNLKNGLLHYPVNHQGNNNGSLMNGKNGIGLGVPDKYDEQDPLTGLYTQKHIRPHEPDESDSDSELSNVDGQGPGCGLFGCRPKWARNFASTNVFMIVFLLAYILQGMYMTYFVSVITTIEKLFQIKSKTTGLLLSASEMGQISTAMLLTYFAGRGHRPRWIACGMVLFSIAAFSCSLPHFIFGKQLMQSLDHLSNGGNGGNTALRTLNGQVLQASYGLRGINDTVNATSANIFEGGISALIKSSHDVNLCRHGQNATRSSAECDEDQKLEQASHSKITVIVLCIFFASLLSSGIGQTAVATLGIPYIDDNVASKQSPMYMAITIGVRILGPASGFIVGSFCTRWYVNFSNPEFDASDPRWIGAWWLGPVGIGSLMMLSSIAMFSFPKQLRGKRKPSAVEAKENVVEETAATAEVDEKPKLRDFPKTVRRQLSNDILMFRTASCVFHLLPIAGLYTFLPKYLETQFRVTTYDANMIAAFCGILVMGIGIVISGLVILKLKPSARSVAAWIAFTALFYSAGMVILMFVGCSMNDFAGYKTGTSNNSAMIEEACDLNCSCDKENFAPICGVDGRIYISTCHAGCESSSMRESDSRVVFSNCTCIPDSLGNPEPYQAVNGYCDSNCKNFVFFILIFVVCVFMHSTSEVGSMLLVMRCTHPKDKAMAMGIIQSAIGLFGNVPCPIIYGAVVDSACLIWKSVCGKHGACSLYDADSFRHYFLGITAGIMFLAFLMDLVVWSKAHRIDITPEDSNEPHGKQTAAETECKKSMVAPDTSV
ncbi:solute carrier organic anion transporter family member 74D-like [Rhagoletis pomonella]|uniref:solute carrier organic anion transporter family member 74D-like n=1 Tax=Rhagoletis pomonella TaxID=28610 RepID=UPI001785608F|nr:solute carrier organic anion transporter family member 74D-like [Rhagoletis pomonella]XP_036335832.1 solute carrier organic anion transporter family member 74D-like [Rhagoletis pomonella]